MNALQRLTPAIRTPRAWTTMVLLLASATLLTQEMELRAEVTVCILYKTLLLNIFLLNLEFKSNKYKNNIEKTKEEEILKNCGLWLCALDTIRLSSSLPDHGFGFNIVVRSCGLVRLEKSNSVHLRNVNWLMMETKTYIKTQKTYCSQRFYIHLIKFKAFLHKFILCVKKEMS